MSSAMLPPGRIGFSRQLHFFPKTKMSLKSVFTHVASIYANLLEQKKKALISIGKDFNSHRIGFGHQHGCCLNCFGTPICMASVTSCENTLQSVEMFLKQIVSISLFRDNSPRWDGFWIWSYYCLARSDLQMQSIPD